MTRDIRNFNNQARENVKTNTKRFPPHRAKELEFEVGEELRVRPLFPKKGRPHQRAFHWPAGGGPFECTQDLEGFNGKCVGCQAYPDKKDKGYRRVSPVVEVIDYRYFHQVDDPSDDRRYALVRCAYDEADPDDVSQCPYCNDPEPEIALRRFGGHKIAELSKNQWASLWSAHISLQNYCIAPDENGDACGHPLSIVAVLCSNPKCEAELLDEASWEALSPRQRVMTLENKQHCEACGTAGYVSPMYIDEAGGRSLMPSEVLARSKDKTLVGVVPDDATHLVVQGSMFDQDLLISVKEKVQREYVSKVFEIDTGVFDWSEPTRPLIEELGFTAEQAEDLCKPWDLDEHYLPERWTVRKDEVVNQEQWVADVLDSQAKRCGVENPFGNIKNSRAAGGWGAKGGTRSFKRPDK